MTAILVKATVILLVMLIAVRLSARSRAAVRHLLLTAGFAVLLALPLTVAIGPSVAVPLNVTPIPFVEHYIVEPAFFDSESPVEAAMVPGSASANGPTWTVTTAELLTAVWVSGVLLFAAPLFAGLAQVARVRQTGRPWGEGQRMIDALAAESGIRRRIDVLLHQSVAAPATCGIIRHVVIFPIDAGSWSKEDLLRAAVHEVEHVRRADCLVHAVARLVCAAYWCHPLVWIALRRLMLEAERACDDAVLGRSEATGYADQLVTLAGRLSTHARQPLLAMANRSDLVHRVAAVLDQRQARGHASTVVAAAIALAACALTVTLAPLQAVNGSAATASEGIQSAAAGTAPRFEVATVRINRTGDLRGRHSAVPATGQLTITNVTAPAAKATPQAASAQPAFEVVSIRRNTSTTTAPTSRVEGGRYLSSNLALQSLIADAYRMPARLIVGGPDWIRSPPGPLRANEIRFDIVANVPPETPAARIPLMLRTLLAERFKLAVHAETQKQEAYALVHAREDKRRGPQLTPSTQQCQTEIAAGPLRAPVTRVTDDGKPVCGMMLSPMAIRGGGLTMTFLANALATYAGRLVVDRTGLEGPFDFELTYAPAGRGATPPSPSDDRPSIFTAVQDQLGLKLEPSLADVQVLVIDQVSMPTDN